MQDLAGDSSAASGGGHSTKRLVSYAAGARGANYVVTVLLTLLVSPIVLHTLGPARYGTWSLIAQLSGYYGVLDWGVRSAVGYYVASLIPKGRSRELNSIVSTALVVLVGVGLLMAAAGLGFAAYVNRVFNLAGSDPREARTAFAVVSLTVACSLPFDVFGAIVTGCRRVYLTTTADMVVRIASSAIIVFVLLRGAGLVTLAAIQLAGRAIVWLTAVGVSRHLLPGLRFGPREANWHAARELADYGSKTFLINLASLVIYRVDLVVVGAFLNVSLVTRYTIGQTLGDYAFNAVNMLAQSFTPHFTYVLEREGLHQVRHMYLRGASVAGALAMLLVGGIAVFGRPFIALWLGESMVAGPWSERSDVILLILLVGLAPRFLQSISWQLMFGLRKVNVLSVVEVLEATLNLGLSLWWVRIWGAAGVALGSAIPLIITNVVVMPWCVMRVLRMGAGQYFRSALLPALIVGSVVGASGLVLTRIVAPTRWLSLVWEVAATSGIGGICAWMLVLSREDRAAAVALSRRAIRLVRSGRLP